MWRQRFTGGQVGDVPRLLPDQLQAERSSVRRTKGSVLNFGG